MDNTKSVDEIMSTTVTQSPDEIEKHEGSSTRTVSAPHLLLKIAQKYNISRSEALQEGILMLLNRNDAFIESGGTIEAYYRERGVYREKINSLTRLISKLGTGDK